ncbi:MAG: glycosyl transferase family 1, partial [Bacteroidetes bacterium]
MVVPLFSGSGMRIKIIEAMALGKTVISTTLGLEGNPAQNNREVLVANNENEFLNKIDYLLSQPQKNSELGDAAKKFVNIHFNQKIISKKVQEFYLNLLK